MIIVETYWSEKASRKGFGSAIKRYQLAQDNEKQKPVNILGHDGIWNKALFNPSASRTSRAMVMVLRRRRYVITLLSPNEELLLRVEGALRSLFKDGGL